MTSGRPSQTRFPGSNDKLVRRGIYLLRRLVGISISLLLLGGVPALAATPERATLHRGDTVVFKGGPLTSFGLLNLPDPAGCTASTCDSFYLDIEMPARAGQVLSKVDLDLKISDPQRMFVTAYEPGDDRHPTYTFRSPQTRMTMVEPKNGVWRFYVGCYCAASSYEVAITGATSDLSVPSSLPGGRFVNHELAGLGAGEPGIATGPHNEIYVNAPVDGVTVWNSVDKGETFSRTDQIEQVPPGSTGDSDLAVAPDDGTVYAANLSLDAFTNWVYVSQDHGATFAGPSWAGSNSDRQWLAAGPNGVVYMLYHDIAPLGSENIWVLRSADHGKTFVPSGNVTLANPGNYKDSTGSCGNVTD